MFCRFCFISLVFLLNGFSCLAQDSSGTLIVFRQYSKGGSIPSLNDSCRSNIRFMIWLYRDTTYFQKFSATTDINGAILKSCSSTVVPNRRSEIFNIVLNHLSDIRSDTIKPFVTNDREIRSNHPGIYSIAIKLGDLLLEKEVEEWHLRKNIDELVNQNYDWNRTRFTARLIEQILTEIKELSP